jgi:uncharacterized protein YjbJ (UPF0337 family)
MDELFRSSNSPFVAPENGTLCTPLSLSTECNSKGVPMDREHVKGAAEKAKGAIKDTAGKITGDKKLQSEGKFDKAKGSAHNVTGNVKDAVKKSGE